MARILLIDDDKIHRRIIREILQAEGHEVTEAKDGHEGLREQDAQDFQLIITDILMPGMEGIETVRELLRRYPELKIIAISAYGMDYLDAARKFGATEILAKPFEPQDLAACVNRCLA